MHDRDDEGPSRLRIGGWLASGGRPPADTRALPGRPARRALPAAPPSKELVLAKPGGTTDGIHIGRHRSGRRWWRLAAASAAAALVVIGIVQMAGDGDTATTPAAAPPSPLPADLPEGDWSLTTPTVDPEVPVSIAPPPPSFSAGPVNTRVPTTAPHSPSATPAPVTPTVSVTAGTIPSLVDLSAEGSRDWVHWGLAGADSVNRRGGTAQIEDLGGSPRGRYDNNPQLYRWSGGTPTASAGRTPTGVYACGQGATITLRAPAGPATRTLSVYAGVWMAAGRLTVTVDGASASRTLENREAISTQRFEIRYRAKAGSKLTVTWTATAVHHPTCGNIDLQAATLS
ncbi:hypothetical protein KZ829_33885 [Actinoplanes hulinensis]|uniref:Uncharacterized protein n=1 Tax=Actinoplanes hulinensis TaxID=1144547 RepID=A0ABS7BCI4_9ACTN|nr:hypothetical protein [Actinoplanes hulinensis]MBW6438731.1 hypothetical protein [Actinoplanes hulinensis]